MALRRVREQIADPLAPCSSSRRPCIPGSRRPGPPCPSSAIVLPTYNRLPLLREAANSVRAQTFEDWELIVLDDGSDEGTMESLQAPGG